MSISAASLHSSLWNNVATALPGTPQATGSRPKFHPNDAGDSNRAAPALAAQGSTLLDALSSASQAALIQVQGQR